MPKYCVKDQTENYTDQKNQKNINERITDLNFQSLDKSWFIEQTWLSSSHVMILLDNREIH